MLRRMWIKMPSLRPPMVGLFVLDQRLQALGAHRPELDAEDLTPAPLPGGERRGKWRWTQTPQGPNAIALENVH